MFTKENARYYGKLSRKSPDAYQLTHEDQVNGGKAAYEYLLNNKPEVLLWLKKKIKAHNRQKQISEINTQLEEAREHGKRRTNPHIEETEHISIPDNELPF